MGPLIDEGAVQDYEDAIDAALEQGGKLLYGGKVLKPPFGRRTFVQPTIIEIDNKADIVQNETFAPILYVMKYKKLDQALKLHNDVPQGLSSAIYTDSVSEGEASSATRVRLRHRQREHRHLGRGDRRRLRWREGDRRRPRERQRRLEGLHAPADQHHQLGRRDPPGPGGGVQGLALVDQRPAATAGRAVIGALQVGPGECVRPSSCN